MACSPLPLCSTTSWQTTGRFRLHKITPPSINITAIPSSSHSLLPSPSLSNFLSLCSILGHEFNDYYVVMIPNMIPDPIVIVIVLAIMIICGGYYCYYGPFYNDLQLNQWLKMAVGRRSSAGISRGESNNDHRVREVEREKERKKWFVPKDFTQILKVLNCFEDFMQRRVKERRRKWKRRRER